MQCIIDEVRSVELSFVFKLQWLVCLGVFLKTCKNFGEHLVASVALSNKTICLNETTGFVEGMQG